MKSVQQTLEMVTDSFHSLITHDFNMDGISEILYARIVKNITNIGVLHPKTMENNVVRINDIINTFCIMPKIFFYLIFPMVGGLTYEVVARYAFNAPTIWAYDVTYMLYGTHFMLGATYCLFKKGHIRTDMIYENLSPKTQGWIDALCYFFLFFPGMIYFFAAGWAEAMHA